MSNLYTTIVKDKNPRINILYQLKLAYKNKPINWNQIDDLKQKLLKFDFRNPNPRKQLKSSFNGNYINY